MQNYSRGNSLTNSSYLAFWKAYVTLKDHVTGFILHRPTLHVMLFKERLLWLRWLSYQNGVRSVKK